MIPQKNVFFTGGKNCILDLFHFFMDLMLFTVYHVTEIFQRRESGFCRGSITSALLLFHTELLGSWCVTGLVQPPWDPPWGWKKPGLSSFPHFHFSQRRANELSLPQDCCHPGRCRQTENSSLCLSFQNLWHPKSLQLGHQHSAAGDGAGSELPVQRIPNP